MLRFFKHFIFSFNIIAMILLGGSYLAAYISPQEAWLFALLGLAYPFLLLLNILFALFWLFQFNPIAFFSIGMIALGLPFFRQTFQLRAFSGPAEEEIRLVSYNAGQFGFFQSRWELQGLSERLAKIDPHILCVQEFLNIRSGKHSTLDSLRTAAGFRYAVFEKLRDGRKRGEYGMAILSDFKPEGSGLVNFDGLTGNMCIYADLRVDTAVYRVYNVHLQSFKFRKQDYSFVEKLPEDGDARIRGSRSILKRMKDAYTRRAEQVEAIREHIASSPYPHFLLGDFNDPPVSYSYHCLSDGLKDAFVENGSGMGKTYNGIMPSFRIDYILFPAAFSGNFYKTYKLGSDHSLISAGLKYIK